MTQKQKAEAYDKALKQIKECVPDDNGFIIIYPQELFPELKEPEDKDERIRKALIKYFTLSNEYAYNEACGVSFRDIVVWLEKQKAVDILDEKEREFADNVDSYRKEVDAAYQKGYNEGVKATLEKQSDPSPYSGVSFEYNGHTFGMCARDNGVEIGIDCKLKAFVSLEKSFIYPIHHQPELAPKSALEAIKEEKVDNANKVEPKFKAGNWYQCTKDFFGKGVTFDKNTAYYCAQEGCLQDEYGCHIAIVKDLYDNFKLWTIQDAGDGDILQLGKVTAIFKRFIGNENCRCYCSIYEGEFEIPNQKSDDSVYGCYNAIPATKEQRNILEKAMADAGWEFDFEKKELKKIEESENIKNQIMSEITDLVKDYITQKPTAWSEEDECCMAECINAIATKDGWSFEEKRKTKHWLKALKDRVGCEAYCTTTKEWSEEDRERIQRISDFIWKNRKGDTDDIYQQEQDVKWLKSLRPQEQWKPSEEQMEALDFAANCIVPAEFCVKRKVLKELLEQLKKL